jgi:hypothetical protein
MPTTPTASLFRRRVEPQPGAREKRAPLIAG